MPSDEALAKLAVHEEEELFDGQMYAFYKTHRTFAADWSQGCEVVLFTERSAHTERTCESRIFGQTNLDEKMGKPNASGDKTIIEEDSEPWPSCNEKLARTDYKGLPSDDAGGVLCQWTSLALSRQVARLLGTTPPREPEDDPFADTCVYEKLPEYHFRANNRLVTLKTRGSTKSRAGNDLSPMFGDLPAIQNKKLVQFSDGKPIPAERFTRAAMEAFLKLPGVTAVGAP
jgi:hypothetical protein